MEEFTDSFQSEITPVLETSMEALAKEAFFKGFRAANKGSSNSMQDWLNARIDLGIG